MKDSIILEGKIYISARRAAKIINYAQDYIGQLCRAGKLDCKMVGRSWFVTEESLLAHREQAIDNTQERVLKVIKNNDVVIRETIRSKVENNIAPKVEEKKLEVKSESKPVEKSEPVLSPIQSSEFKYEAEKASFLPELRKKVPSGFSIPKDSLKLTPKLSLAEPKKSLNNLRVAKTKQPAGAVAIQTVNPFVTVTVLVLVALTGFFFTLSVSKIGNKNLSYGNEASVASAARELVSEIMRSLGFKGRNPVPLAKIETNSNAGFATTTTDYNGIGIFPSISEEEDEIAKQKIMNSFSDEVIIKRDQSGTSGVITPVFKKAEGDDFVYVLVPVDEKKQ